MTNVQVQILSIRIRLTLAFQNLKFGFPLAFACLPVGRDFDIWHFFDGGFLGNQTSEENLHRPPGHDLPDPLLFDLSLVVRPDGGAKEYSHLSSHRFYVDPWCSRLSHARRRASSCLYHPAGEGHLPFP